MNENVLIIFLGSVFLTVFLLSQILILPTFGTSRGQREKLKQRFDRFLTNRGETHHEILKKQYLDQLSPFTRWIESRSLMAKLKMTLEQGGITMPAYHFVLRVFFLCAVIAFLAWKYTNDPLLTLITVAVAFYLPIFWLQKKRAKNLEVFEEQLPEALQMMARSLQTGYPFNECLKIIAEEMPNPIAREFGLVFEEVNYGRNLEIAFALLIERIPSVSLSVMATSVMIQRETGGNMSEILINISDILRGRFKLQRRVKTLSAEGIFSAWVLCLTPFVMYLALSVINPDHFTALLEHPSGIYLFYIIGVLEVIAMFWMRMIVNIDV